MGVSEVYVSITRIQKFLEFPERPDLQLLENNNNDTNDIMDDNEKGDSNVHDDGDAASDNSKNNSNDDDIVISISNVDCYWNYIQQATAATPPATTELLLITDESADASKIMEGKKDYMKLLGSTFLRRRLILVFVVDLFLSLFLLKREKKRKRIDGLEERNEGMSVKGHAREKKSDEEKGG